MIVPDSRSNIIIRLELFTFFIWVLLNHALAVFFHLFLMLIDTVIHDKACFLSGNKFINIIDF